MQATRFHAGERLSDDELLEPSGACPFCGHRDLRSTGIWFQRDPEVALLQCVTCGAASASRMPRATVLDAYYARYFDRESSASDADGATTFDETARLSRHIDRVARPERVPAEARVLDFGGGDARVATQIAEAWVRTGRCRAVHVTSVDYQAPRPPSDPGVTISHIARLDEASITSRGHDVVIASAIVEHIPELRHTLERLVAQIAPGGALYARTPWIAAIARRFPSLDMGFPGHVHDLGPAFWGGLPAALDASLMVTRSCPSIVENSWRRHPIRALAAHLLKAPSHVESRLRGPRARTRWWRWVGGWEVVLRRPSDEPDTRTSATARHPVQRQA